MDEAEVGNIADRRGFQRMVASSEDFFHSIKGKIFILFAVTFLSIGVLAGLNYWSLSTVSQRLKNKKVHKVFTVCWKTRFNQHAAF